MKNTTQRVDKFLANRGISARRSIEDILQQNTLTINGKRVTKPGERFDPQNDVVLMNGKHVEKPDLMYIKLHKPHDVLSTASDEFGRTTVVSLVPSKERLYPVGRLDRDTTGLLLLTNDGELANRLTHPRYHIPKTYLVTIRGNVPSQKLELFRKGVLLEDGITAPAKAKVIKEDEKVTVIEVVLYQGKKRQIRRMCETLHLPLVALKRIAMGPITLGDLAESEYKPLTKNEIEDLKKEAYKSL